MPRTIAKVVIGVAAGVATFALLLVLLDTDPQPTEDVAPPTDASGNAS